MAGLPSGPINVTVVAPGFKKYQAKGVKLQVGQKARADVALQVGATKKRSRSKAVNVAQVETQSSDLSGTVTGKQITQLQLNGRNFTQLVTLVPGVSNQTGQDEGTVGINGNVGFSINGGRTEYNNWELDGGDNMDNGSNSTLNVYPSLEAIAEFKVLTSNYGAQYGRNGSGTVEVETKSGTNGFHGNAYEFVRNDVFNATNYFLQIQRSALQEERFRIHHRRTRFIPGFTTRTARPSSSGRRNGAETACRPDFNVSRAVAGDGPVISAICVQQSGWLPVPVDPATGPDSPPDTSSPSIPTVAGAAGA